MKNLSLLFLLCCSTLSNAQYFAPQGATWHYSESPVGPWTYQQYFMKFEVTGDTVVNGKACSIIHKDRKAECYSRNDDEFVYYSNDSVFFYDPAFSQFQMIYNFNANAGDSWDIIVFGSNSATDLDTNTVSVDSTDLISINGQNLKRQYVTYKFNSEGFNWEYPSTIIERIGDTRYMFNYYADYLGICDMNFGSGLRCYDDPALGFYETGIADSCEYYQLANIFEKELSSFQIVPNPASNFIQINMTNGFPDAVRVLNAQGGLIRRTDGSIIDVSEFQTGIYFVSVLQNEKWTQQRFVKR